MPQICFFGPDVLENDCWVVKKRACDPETSYAILAGVTHTLWQKKSPEKDESLFVPLLTCCHESRVMTERILSYVQAAEMGLFHGMTLRDERRNFDIGKDLNVNIFLF